MYAVGEDDLIRRCADADLRQAHLKLSPQRRVALGRAVAHRADVGTPGEAAQGTQHAGFVQPRGGQAAGAGQDALRVAVGHLAHQPAGVDGALDGIRAGDGAGGLGAARHVEAGAAAGLQVTHRHQPVVGFDHGEARHPVMLGELADRRQARAGAQDAVVDAGAHGGDDLIHQRGGAVGGEGEQQHGGLRCIGRNAGPDGRTRPVREGGLSG